jgi:hypothetical protein
VTRDQHASQFVVLHHTVGDSLDRTSESHFDWMFAQHGSLRTFATPVIESLDSEVEMTRGVIERDAQQLPHHRIEYLNHEGEISGGRGHVHRVIAGTFDCLGDRDHEFVARLTWQDARGPQQVKAAFYRIRPDDLSSNVNRDAWRLLLTR